jgi:hypothetical protein
MAYDYSQSLQCLKCLQNTLNTQLKDEFLDSVDNKLVEDNFYKSINRKMFYNGYPNIYMPQLNDEVYFIFQGYEEAVGYYPYHFITCEEERNKPINDYLKIFYDVDLTLADALTHQPIKCRITGLDYQLPSATTYEMNQKLETGNDEFNIQTFLELTITGIPIYNDVKFSIIYFASDDLSNDISRNYLIPNEEFEQSLQDEELNDVVGNICNPVNNIEANKEMLEVNDFEPEIYKD